MFLATEKDALRQARYVILAGMAALVPLSQGCVALQVRKPLPEHLLDQAQRDEMDYNLAYIPVDFHPKRPSEFDTQYMNQEFELAFSLARSGYKWHKYPPGIEPANSQTAPGPPDR